MVIDNSNNWAAGGYGTAVPMKVSWSPLPICQVWTNILSTVSPSTYFNDDGAVPMDVCSPYAFATGSVGCPNLAHFGIEAVIPVM